MKKFREEKAIITYTCDGCISIIHDIRQKSHGILVDFNLKIRLTVMRIDQYY